jgi:hypothetical protein
VHQESVDDLSDVPNLHRTFLPQLNICVTDIDQTVKPWRTLTTMTPESPLSLNQVMQTHWIPMGGLQPCIWCIAASPPNLHALS